MLNPDFGSRLRLLLYEGMVDHNVEAIMAEIQRCFTEWEPRAVLKNVVHVKSLDDAEHNTIRLDVYYTIKGLDQEQYVYSYTYAAGSD